MNAVEHACANKRPAIQRQKASNAAFEVQLAAMSAGQHLDQWANNAELALLYVEKAEAAMRELRALLEERAQ